jgi:hypothetical protein
MDDDTRQAVSTMFTTTKKLFTPNGHYTWKGNVNAMKLGIVASTKAPRFVNYALGKDGFDRVITAQRKNIIDLGLVVFADADEVMRFTFISAFSAIELQPRLEALPTRMGNFGEFWVLPPGWARDDFDGQDAW